MPGGDPEFIYQFNRHRYWICMGQAYALTGNEDYAACFKEQLSSWILENPITEAVKKDYLENHRSRHPRRKLVQSH